MNSKIFFTSDTHFSHRNIIDYCSRPYNSVDEMNESLVKNWNAKVGKNDIVWHLGDFAFGNVDYIASIVSALNGKINLVLGNHDHNKLKSYYECGFNRVYDRPVIIDKYFILSHAPMEFLNHNCPFYNIYGHVHDSSMYRTWSKSGCCVCVERHDYAPISFKEIKDNIESLINT